MTARTMAGVGVCAVLAGAAWMVPAHAQMMAPGPSPNSARGALAAAAQVGVILVPFDDLNSPVAPGRVPPARAATGTGAIAPIQADLGGAAPFDPFAPEARVPGGAANLDDLRVPLPGIDVEAPRFSEPGVSQTAASLLRSALVARGFGESVSAAPDSATIMRAINAGELAPRVLEQLRLSLATLAQTPDDAVARELAIDAASRLGRVLGFEAVIPIHVRVGALGDNSAVGAEFLMLSVDARRATGQVHRLSEAESDATRAAQSGAITAAAVLEGALTAWTPVSADESAALLEGHLESARLALASGDTDRARDELTQAIALDPSSARSHVMLGDALSASDPAASARAYRRAVELNARDGGTWAKIAAAHANAPSPDWPRALEAGRRALATGYDSMPLRLAMAKAQFGRADIFRRASRIERAEDAEVEARSHLDRVLQLAPEDLTAIRLLARSLIGQNRFDEAVQVLDRAAPRHGTDLELQSLYAGALVRRAGREEDAFAAYSRLWQNARQSVVDVDAATYRSLAQGFDVRVFNLGRSGVLLANGAASATVARESALLQISRLKEDMEIAEYGIGAMRAPASISPAAAAARVFAADLTNQSLESLQAFLETGQEVYRARGLELYRQAVNNLNQARSAT